MQVVDIEMKCESIKAKNLVSKFDGFLCLQEVMEQKRVIVVDIAIRSEHGGQSGDELVGVMGSSSVASNKRAFFFKWQLDLLCSVELNIWQLRNV